MKSAILTIALAAAITASAAFAEDGELFPEVKSYDEQVQSPVSKPEKPIEPRKPVGPPLPPPAPAEPEKPSETAPEIPPRTSPQTAPPAPKTAPPIRWEPYRKNLLDPLMSEASQHRYTNEFAPLVKQKLKETSIIKTDTADMLWKQAQATDLAPDLQRALLLQSLGLSIHARATLEDRAAKARTVLPLLKEETLAVAQARADTLTELAFGAMANASDQLLEMLLESQAKLARMQIQAGYPEQAAASLKIAREAYRNLRTKTPAQRDTIAEAAAWADRSAAARTLSARWQETLKKSPADPLVNTHLAVLNLSLYGDVEQAAAFAARSDRKELKALAATLQKKEDESTRHALTVAAALLEVAQGSAVQPFDAYSIASLVKSKLSALVTAGNLSAADAAEAKKLQALADTTITRSAIRPPSTKALASLAGPDPKSGAATAPADKLQLFVKDNGTLVKYVKPTPKQDAEALAFIRQFANDCAAKMTANAGPDKPPVKFTEIQTAHCIIFTDWPASEHAFLKNNVEGAYVAVAKTFDFPLNENVFPAKLPVFMFDKEAGFTDFANKDYKQDVSKFNGYFNVDDNGIGFLNMFKAVPRKGHPENEVLNEWGRTLCHITTVAFCTRYRTNKSFPGWITKALSAYVSTGKFPLPSQHSYVRGYLRSGKSVEDILTEKATGVEIQTVGPTVIEMLIQKNPRAFIDMLNKLKDGEDPQAAMKATYNWTYADVDTTWQKWIQTWK